MSKRFSSEDCSPAEIIAATPTLLGNSLDKIFVALLSRLDMRALTRGSYLRESESKALSLPETVEVAVGEDALYLVAGRKGEGGARNIARMQHFALVSAFGLECDPLDVMLLRHRMDNGADLNGNQMVMRRHNRYVLFLCAVGFAGDELVHGFAATYRFDRRFFHHADDLAADVAFVEFHFLCLLWVLDGGSVANRGRGVSWNYNIGVTTG